MILAATALTRKRGRRGSAKQHTTVPLEVLQTENKRTLEKDMFNAKVYTVSIPSSGVVLKEEQIVREVNANLLFPRVLKLC